MIRYIHPLLRIRERQMANFIPWGPASIQVALTRKSHHYHESSSQWTDASQPHQHRLSKLFRYSMILYKIDTKSVVQTND